jgi:hypothetical protein
MLPTKFNRHATGLIGELFRVFVLTWRTASKAALNNFRPRRGLTLNRDIALDGGFIGEREAGARFDDDKLCGIGRPDRCRIQLLQRTRTITQQTSAGIARDLNWICTGLIDDHEVTTGMGNGDLAAARLEKVRKRIRRDAIALRQPQAI